MRKVLLALAAFATIGVAVPAATSQADAQTVVVRHGGGHHGGYHRGHRANKAIAEPIALQIKRLPPGGLCRLAQRWADQPSRWVNRAIAFCEESAAQLLVGTYVPWAGWAGVKKPPQLTGAA
jgi:hypothetical protein